MRFLTLLALCSPALFAQDSALLSGSVIDPAGAGVANAGIRMSSLTSSFTRETVTNGGGDFVFDMLAPGQYSLTVTKDAFQTLKLNRVILRSRDRRSVLLRVKPGETSKVDTIDDPRAGLAADISTGASLDRLLLAHLPVNGRNATSLFPLAPSALSGSATGAQFSVHGLAPALTYATLDGLNLLSTFGGLTHTVDEVREPLSRSTATLIAPTGTAEISLDSLGEVRFQSTSVLPQLGRTAGAQIAMSSRAGGGGFHGSIYEYFRTDKFAANDWLANSLALPRGRLRQHQFGAAAGGPIIADRTFFFGSFEGLRLDAPQTLFATVPDAAFRQSTPASLRPYISAFPLPNGANLGAGTAIYSAVRTFPLDRDSLSFRLDHRLAESHSLFLRANYSNSDADSRGSVFLSPNVVRSYDDNFKSFTAGVTSALNAATTNDFRANYTFASLTTANLLDALNGAIPLDAARASPASVSPASAEFNFNILGLGGYSFGPAVRNKQWQINATDTLTMVAGANSYSIGFDYRYSAPSYHRPLYSSTSYFSSLSSIASDGTQSPGAFLSSKSISSVVASNSEAVYPSFQNLSFFLQDVAKLGSRVTLTFGVRWDINTPPGVRSGPRPLVLSGAFDNRTTQNESLFDTSFTNVAPRLGYTQLISAKPGRELVLRFGVSGFQTFGASAVASSFLGAPYSNVRLMSLAAFPLTGTDLAAPALPAPKPFGLVIAPDRGLQSPGVRQVNLTLEKHLGENELVSAAYLGTRGKRLLRTLAERATNRDYNDLQKLVSVVDSSYHAFQARYERRLSSRLQTQAVYTWSHAIDDNAVYGGIGFSPIFGNERGNSDFDARHLLNFSGSYLAPAPPMAGLHAALRDWHIEWVATARAGLPFDILMLSSTPSADAGAVQTPLNRGLLGFVRPNYNGADAWIPDSNVAGGVRLNTAAFTTPNANTAGDLGRNILYGRPMAQVDLALRREIPFSDNIRLNFSVQAFNVTNSPAYANPNRNEGAFVSSPVFGFPVRSMNAAAALNPSSFYAPGGPRTVQFTFRLQF